MKKSAQHACILLAAGCVIALVPLFFVTGFKAGAGFFANIMALKVWLIPYRFILALGIFLIFIAIKRITDKA